MSKFKMKKVLALLSLFVGVNCKWEDPFLIVNDTAKFPFIPDRDVGGT